VKRFDVAVIGGGIAGTSVASFVSADASVVVLEREATLGVHSTGRSAAVFTECYGEPVVRRLAIASRAFVTQPPEGFADAPILSLRGIVFTVTADQLGDLPASLAQQQALVPSVRGLDASEVMELCPVLDPDVVVGGVYEPDAMDLDVAVLDAGYQRTIRRNGGEIRTGAELEGAERSGDSWLLAAGGDHIEAAVVVNAAGAWCDVVADRCGVAPVGLVRRAVVLQAGGPQRARQPGRCDAGRAP
jgi:D-arginine dehydrogenase